MGKGYAAWWDLVELGSYLGFLDLGALLEGLKNESSAPRFMLNLPASRGFQICSEVFLVTGVLERKNLFPVTRVIVVVEKE